MFPALSAAANEMRFIPVVNPLMIAAYLHALPVDDEAANEPDAFVISPFTMVLPSGLSQ